MRILQVNKFYYPHIGGIENVVRDIAEGLCERTEMDVLVCRERGRGISEIINGVPVNRCGSPGAFFSMPLSLSFINEFRLKSKHADLIHVHMPFPLADIAFLMSGFTGKLVVSWHSEIVRQKKLMRLYKPVMDRFLNRADVIITATRGHIDSSEYLKPYKDKCRIIPYGLDIPSYEDIDADTNPPSILQDRLWLPKNKKALFVGRLVYYKGVETLIDSFRRVRGCELFIAGTGRLERELIKKMKIMDDGEHRGAGEIPVSSRVHFLGKLSFEDLCRAYIDCDFFILPSIANSEAFGIVQLEAMLYGKPVINTSLPTGVPYVSIHGQTGITVPPGDTEALAKAVQRLADDDELRQRLGENAYNRVRTHFNLDKILDDIYGLYSELLTPRG